MAVERIAPAPAIRVPAQAAETWFSFEAAQSEVVGVRVCGACKGRPWPNCESPSFLRGSGLGRPLCQSALRAICPRPSQLTSVKAAYSLIMVLIPGETSMRTVEDLMKLATECHDRARLESNPLTRAQFRVMGDDYWKQAEELKKQVRSAALRGAESPSRSYH